MLTYLKNHWKLLLTVVLLLGAFAALAKRREDNYVQQIIDLRKIQQQELDKINAARADEAKKTAENQKRYEDALQTLSAQYQETLQKLDVAKKQRVQVILQDKTPEVLANTFAQAFGFQVVK